MIVLKKVGGRLLQAAITLLVVCVAIFFVVRLLPGDPVLQILGNEATPESIAALRAQMNLDQPLWTQFTLFLGDAVRGDLGNSLIRRNIPVTEIIAASLPSTVAIATAGLVVGIGLGVWLGLLGAVSRRKSVDVAVQTFSIASYATPTFLFALVLVLVFALILGWLPAGGWPGQWPQNFAYVVLPAVALGVNLAPRFLRAVRQAGVDVQRTLFIEAAVARGIPRSMLNLRHVLPNSLLPVITLAGMSLGGLLTNAVIVEAVFAIPGLGSELATAVNSRDYPVIQGITLFMAVMVIAGNFLADALYALADPRARVD